MKQNRRDTTATEYETVVRESPDGIVVVNKDGEVLYANPAAGRAFGLSLRQLVGTSLGVPVIGRQVTEIDLWSGRTMELRASRIFWRAEPAHLLMLRDVTERVQMLEVLSASNQRLEEMVVVDSLTGVFNRRGIDNELTAVARSASRLGGPASAILVDCDNFKRINDSAGYGAGDATLRAVAAILRRAVRASTDRVGRIGGDEFLVLLPETTTAEAFLIAAKIRAAIERMPPPVTAPGGVSQVTVSLGIAPIRQGATFKEVVAAAEIGLRASKGAGKNRVSAGADDDSEDQASCEVHSILASPDRLRVVAQPIVGPGGGPARTHELLVRGPRGTALESPTALFQAARHANLLGATDLVCLRRCIETAATFADADCLHVNIFPSTLLDTPIEMIEDIITQPRQAQIAIELSEQELVGDPSLLKESLAAIRRKGVLIGLDDVGFGRSSLETLVVLEPDIVKLDRSVVHGVSGDAARRRILERLLGCLMPLGPRIIAEGVETEADARMVADLGVVFAQGYHNGHPQPAPSADFQTSV